MLVLVVFVMDKFVFMHLRDWWRGRYLGV